MLGLTSSSRVTPSSIRNDWPSNTRLVIESAKISPTSGRSKFRIVAACFCAPAAEVFGSNVICFSPLRLAAAAIESIVFAEARIDQDGQGFDHLRRLLAGRLDNDRGTGGGGEHHQSHDRGAAYGFAAPHDADVGVELLDRLHEFGGCTGVQSFAIADVE